MQNTPIFEENGPDKFKGIDIMRAVRSFDPCLPCGVHMYLGNGKVLETAALADVRQSRLTRCRRQTELERRIAAIDQLVRSLENAADPATRAAAQELAGRSWISTPRR